LITHQPRRQGPARPDVSLPVNGQKYCKPSTEFHEIADINPIIPLNLLIKTPYESEVTTNAQANLEVMRKPHLKMRNLSQNQKNVVIFRAGW